MKQKVTSVNALDGISKAFYVEAENGTSTLALDVRVQWSSALSDPLLDLVQDRLERMSLEVLEALQKEAQERSQ